MDSNIAQALNEMDEDSKGVFVGFTNELIDKLNVLIRRERGDNEPTPIDFATFVEEVRGECNALARLAGFMNGSVSPLD